MGEKYPLQRSGPHGPRGAAAKELMRQRQMAALEQAAGAWKKEDHPELKRGAIAYVRKLRRESERRFRKHSPQPFKTTAGAGAPAGVLNHDYRGLRRHESVRAKQNQGTDG